MLIGTGIDLAEIPRIRNSIARFGNRFLDRIFTPGEKAYCLRKRNAAESFAARFASAPDETVTEAERKRDWEHLRQAWQRRYGLMEAG